MAFELLPANLKTQDGKITTSDALKDKEVIGIYFSAHWCPPCRGFTPQLAEWYKNFKESHPSKDKLEIIFASSDNDQAAFDEYFKEMPWLAVPYEDRDAKQKLSKKFKVDGIPTLVFLNGQGELITTKGRSIISSDPKAENYPWPAKSLTEILGDKFINSKGETVGKDAFEGKVLGLYFSAHWCPPCRGFTPKLIETYKKLQEAGKDFEIIFVSSDRDEESFKEYYETMPWLALPYEDRARKAELGDHFDVSGIPSFIILDADRKVINASARGAVDDDPEGVEFPWAPKPISKLNGSNISQINDGPAFIYFTEDEDDVDDTIEALKPIAEAEAEASSNASRDQIFFFVAAQDNQLTEAIVNFASLKPQFPQALILSVPDREKYVAPNSELNADTFNTFVTDYIAGKLEGESL